MEKTQTTKTKTNKNELKIKGVKMKTTKTKTNNNELKNKGVKMQTEKTKTNKNELKIKGLLSAETYLTNNGYKVINTNQYQLNNNNVICAINNKSEVHIIEVIIIDKSKNFISDKITKRKELEAIMIDFIANHCYVDMSVMYDTLQLIVLSESKGFIRHHINADLIK